MQLGALHCSNHCLKHLPITLMNYKMANSFKKEHPSVFRRHLYRYLGRIRVFKIESTVAFSPNISEIHAGLKMDRSEISVEKVTEIDFKINPQH